MSAGECAAGKGGERAFGRIETHSIAALEEDQALRLHGLDDALGGVLDGSAGRDVDGEVGHAAVLLVHEGVLAALVEAEEDDERELHGAVVGAHHLLLGLRKGVLADDGADVVMAREGQVGVVLCQRREVVEEEEGGGGRGEGGGDEGVVAAEEGDAVQGRPGEVVGGLLAEFARQH